MNYLVSAGFVVAGAVAMLRGIYAISLPAGYIALGCMLLVTGLWPHWVRR